MHKKYNKMYDIKKYIFDKIISKIVILLYR